MAESQTGSNNIPSDEKYPKLSKAASGYLELEQFKNADLHTGYFCYDCTYFIKDTHCAIVEDSGLDVNGKESGAIAPYGVCTLWDPNEKETHLLLFKSNEEIGRKEKMTKITEKIKEAVGAADNLSKFKKFSKLKASYIEYDKFEDSNLHEGYFCYNCIYWINAGGGKCMLVEDDGPDVMGKVSDVIAPHGCCAGYEANVGKLHDTRTLADDRNIDTEKNKDKVTTADVT